MIKLYKGDCMKIMPGIKKQKLLLTDIPYSGVNRESNGIRTINKKQADILTFDIQMWLNVIWEKADIFIIFCGKNQMSEIFTWFNNKSLKGHGTVRQLVWCKTNPSPMNGEYVYLSSTENAIWFKKKGTGKLNAKCKKAYFNYPVGSSKYHPTEKNHKLLQELILDNTNEGDTVIDCCMGSGSTGIVAKELNRNFIGIEIDEGYYNVAKERIGE